ncbi:MAG: hypothetical protein EA343_07875 [Nodularia sp. (in: Bacteria)]|nr:MAG: hypothetical protein EA343_07875 [Nodularia sp. (in: cyanobacteria)]
MSLVLGTFALISASLGSLAGAISISNIYEIKYSTKIMLNIDEQALINFQNDLILTQNEAKKYSILQEEIVPKINNFMEIIAQDENQEQKSLEEIQELSPIDPNDNLEILKNHHSIGDIADIAQKIVNNILSEDLEIQENVNRLSKWLPIIGSYNIIIASFMVMGNIILSPVILISGLIIYYQVNKDLTKFKEWESEMGTAIAKINLEKGLMQERRKEISELIRQLNDFKKFLNNFESKYKAAKVAGQVVSGVDIAFRIINIFNKDINNFKPIIRIVKLLISKTLNPDNIANNLRENITKQYNNIFVLQLDKIAEVKFERQLLYKSSLELGLKFDILLTVSSTIRQLPQVLEKKNMLFLKLLRKSQ